MAVTVSNVSQGELAPRTLHDVAYWDSMLTNVHEHKHPNDDIRLPFGRTRAYLESANAVVRHQVRSYGLATAIVFTIYFLLQSFHVDTHQLELTTRQSLRKFGQLTPPWRTQPGAPSRITKVSALFGEENDLYEEALRSHERHNELYGYDMKVLRERITNGYMSKPTYMLAVMVNELAKPVEQRTEWLMWNGPDIVLLNPNIPLEIFLPPPDFGEVHFLGTHDQEGLNCGVYFLRVHQWSVRMLLEILATPSDVLGDAAEKDEVAFEYVVAFEGYRDHVQYQPRRWYNAYQISTEVFEGKQGDMAVHFHDLEGDKWSAMARTLALVETRQTGFELPLQATTYESEVADYWERLRVGDEVLRGADTRMNEPAVANGVRRLSFALTYEADKEVVMRDAIDGLKKALATPPVEKTEAQELKEQQQDQQKFEEGRLKEQQAKEDGREEQRIGELEEDGRRQKLEKLEGFGKEKESEESQKEDEPQYEVFEVWEEVIVPIEEGPAEGEKTR